MLFLSKILNRIVNENVGILEVDFEQVSNMFEQILNFFFNNFFTFGSVLAA